MAREKSKEKTKLLNLITSRSSLFSRDEDGAVAVEFGILAIPFFLIIVAILETAVIFLASQALDNAVGDSVRLIRTGQAQEAGFTMTDFRQELCNRNVGLLDCDKIKIRVRVLEDFNAASIDLPIDPDDGSWVIVEQYDDGVGNDIIIAETYYLWPTFLDFFGFNMTSIEGTNKRLLGAARVWKNEPF